jgi:hypothetical protein
MFEKWENESHIAETSHHRVILLSYCIFSISILHYYYHWSNKLLSSVTSAVVQTPFCSNMMHDFYLKTSLSTGNIRAH